MLKYIGYDHISYSMNIQIKKNSVPHICLISTLKDRSWSKMTSGLLEVVLEAKVVSSRVSIWLDTMFLRFLV